MVRSNEEIFLLAFSRSLNRFSFLLAAQGYQHSYRRRVSRQGARREQAAELHERREAGRCASAAAAAVSSPVFVGVCPQLRSELGDAGRDVVQGKTRGAGGSSSRGRHFCSLSLSLGEKKREWREK